MLSKIAFLQIRVENHRPLSGIKGQTAIICMKQSEQPAYPTRRLCLVLLSMTTPWSKNGRAATEPQSLRRMIIDAYDSFGRG